MAGVSGTTTVDKLIFQVEVQDKASRQIDKIKSKTGDLEKSWLKAMAKMAKAASMFFLDTLGKVAKKSFDLFTNQLTKAFKVAEKFQQRMLQSHQALNLVGDAARQLDREVLQLSVDIGGIRTSTFQELYNQASILGLRGSENVKEFVTTIGQLASSTDVVARTAGAQFPAILKQFQVPMDEMGTATRKLSDLVSHLGFNFNATQREILAVMGPMAGAAKTAKLTMREFATLATNVAQMEKRFHTGSSAVVRIMSRMGAKSTQWAQLLKLNVNTFSDAIENRPLEALEMVFKALVKVQEGAKGFQEVSRILQEMDLSGIRTSTVLLKLSNTVKEMTAIYKEAGNAAGATQRAFDISMGKFHQQWNTLLNIGEKIYTLFGTDMVEQFTKFLNLDLNPLLTDFAEWLEKSELIKETWPKILEAIKKAGSKMIDELEKFFKLLEDNTAWEAIQISMTGVWDVFKAETTKAWDHLKKRANPTLDDIKTKTDLWLVSLNDIGASLGIIATAITDLHAAFTAMREAGVFKWLGERIKELQVLVEGLKFAAMLMGKNQEYFSGKTVQGGGPITQPLPPRKTDEPLPSIRDGWQLTFGAKGYYPEVAPSATPRPSQQSPRPSGELPTAYTGTPADYLDRTQGILSGAVAAAEVVRKTGAEIVKTAPGVYKTANILRRTTKAITEIEETAPGVFTNIGVEATKTAESVQTVFDRVAELQGGFTDLADVTYVHSVLPDMSRWLQTVKGNTSDVNEQIERLEYSLQRMRDNLRIPELMTWTAGSSLVHYSTQIAGAEAEIRRLKRSQMVSPERAAGESVSARLTLNITALDERSARGFAARIQTMIEEENEHVVATGGFR